MSVPLGRSRRVLVIVAAMACAVHASPARLHAQSSFSPVTDAMLQNPAPEDWLMWSRTLDSWGYSPLNQVTRENVDELRMVFAGVRHRAAGRDAARLRRRPVYAAVE